MKIIFLFPTPNFSGGCRVVAIYAEGLAKRGHKVTIVATKPKEKSIFDKMKIFIKSRQWLKNRTSKELVKNTHFENIEGVEIKVLEHAGPIKNIDVPNADIVIATWWETAEWMNELSEKKGAKVYFIQHHEVHSHLPINRVKATYQLPFKKITIAQWLVDTMRDKYGDNDVKLVENGVDTSMFDSSPRSKNITPIFCLMYAIESFKGTDVSIAAFEYAKKKHPEIKLLVFGAKEVDEKLPLPEGAIFHLSPSQEKIREIYSLSDAFLFSSRSEGFGLPVLEAMACRCPVIATKAGCAPDFIEHGISGELNDIDDIKAQGESIIKIIEMNNSDWRDLSEAAYKAVRDKSWKNSTNQFERILTEII